MARHWHEFIECLCEAGRQYASIEPLEKLEVPVCPVLSLSDIALRQEQAGGNFLRIFRTHDQTDSSGADEISACPVVDQGENWPSEGKILKHFSWQATGIFAIDGSDHEQQVRVTEPRKHRLVREEW